jgi:uncharacterized protein YwqG
MKKQLRQYRILFEEIEEDRDPISNELGLRSKLGGLPDWDQNDETPTCPSCNQEMVFIGQLDSFEHDEAHNPHRKNCIGCDQHYMFGDVGLIYIFFCFACQESISIVQSG